MLLEVVCARPVKLASIPAQGKHHAGLVHRVGFHNWIVPVAHSVPVDDMQREQDCLYASPVQR